MVGTVGRSQLEKPPLPRLETPCVGGYVVINIIIIIVKVSIIDTILRVDVFVVNNIVVVKTVVP